MRERGAAIVPRIPARGSLRRQGVYQRQLLRGIFAAVAKQGAPFALRMVRGGGASRGPCVIDTLAFRNISIARLSAGMSRPASLPTLNKALADDAGRLMRATQTSRQPTDDETRAGIDARSNAGTPGDRGEQRRPPARHPLGDITRAAASGALRAGPRTSCNTYRQGARPNAGDSR